MEEKPNNPVLQAESEKGTSRRSRKDEEGRDFQCGCGKRYLSYPALYTHIKTKHDGRQPEGTQKCGTAQIAKRTKLKLEQQTIKAMQSYFGQFESEAINQLGEVIRGHISLTSRIKKEGVSKEIYQNYLHLLKQQQEFKLTENSCLQLALITFLINIGDIVNDKIYDQFLAFARLARACFYEHGEELHKVIFSKKDQGPFQIKEFDLRQVKYFPMVSDFFIRFYIPETETKDTHEVNLSLMEVITYDFCNWLLINKLTSIKVNMNQKIEIDFKPPVSVKSKGTPGKVESSKANDQKQNKQEPDGSQQLSEGQEIEEEIERQDKNASGSKEQQEL